MLLRIAPEMLTDPAFNCVTPLPVRDELLKKPKFKEKYPWRSRFKSKVQTLPASVLHDSVFIQALHAVEGTVNGLNERTGKRFGLSPVDQKIAACVVAFDHQLSTGDDDLRDYLKQEFGVSNVSPLEIINDWLARELIDWNDERQAVLEDWKRCNEHAQPKAQIKSFEQITGRTYPAY
jgi:hypothetical protein